MKSKITQAYLAWKSKIHCSLKGEEGPSCLAVPLLLQELLSTGVCLHRGPWRLRKRKANVIRDAFFPRTGTL